MANPTAMTLKNFFIYNPLFDVSEELVSVLSRVDHHG